MKLKTMAILTLAALAAPAFAEDAAPFKDPTQRLSYAIGLEVGRNFERQGIQFDMDMLVRGLKDAGPGAKPLISEKELRAVMNRFQNDFRQNMAAHRRAEAAQNAAKGDAFLAENKKKEGVKTLQNGLQYKVLKAGTGPLPKDGDTLSVIYRGTLIDGSEFDASPEGKPVSMKLNQVIVGWKEAMKLMPVGSRWQLFIPPNLAYGERGVGADIGPNATLVFDVELVGLQ